MVRPTLPCVAAVNRVPDAGDDPMTGRRITHVDQHTMRRLRAPEVVADFDAGSTLDRRTGPAFCPQTTQDGTGLSLKTSGPLVRYGRGSPKGPV